MERKERESERLRVEVTAKCTQMGIKRRRYLNVDESREFLSSGRIPADAVAASSFINAKEVQKLPENSTCMFCGANLSGKSGVIVELKGTHFAGLVTICAAEYEQVVNGQKSESEDAGEEQSEQAAPVAAAPAATPAPAPAASSAQTSVEAALAALTAAIKAPKPAPAPAVNEKAIVEAAVNAAKEEAKSVMRKSVEDFIREGAVPSAEGEPEEEPKPPKAKGDGVKAAQGAASWTAKATPAATSAVDKLNRFLSEFSYFRNGVSMRLINTFAIAADKAAALRSYCEVSQMEDLSDLVEKMKSPEFKNVCDAFKPFSPKPVNRRFAVFYGAPGGGKTYAAKKAGEAINGGEVDIVPCSPSMDAADTLYAYRLDYKTGKRGYIPTALLTAMVSGRAVVLDEVNLLPMEARMFLQNILDNKDKVHVMGQELPIADGFFVIGTMNLETGLGSTPLPLPLVDRACVVREFKTSTAQAAVGAGLC